MKVILIIAAAIYGLSCFGRNGYPIDSLVYENEDAIYGGRLWPNDYYSETERRISKESSISFVMMSSDTLLLIADTSKLFNFGLFQFDCTDQLITAFLDAKIDISPFPVEAIVTNGDLDILKYGAMPDSTDFKLEYGLISSNDLLTLSPHFRIGASTIDISEAFGITRMGIEIPTKRSFHIIFINGVHYKNPMIENTTQATYVIDAYILNNRIQFIKIGGENNIIRESRYPTY